ncbi:2-dehydropantoate 2-reductase [Achromobacter sp. F4_2707]|uniref:ketopantoate reductase family protein n=1 Tax=Achromobacter sp. F4_2707 TaxID=3114286 RepID=UPI0039C6B416
MKTPNKPSPSILIWGAGAIGGCLGAAFVAEGYDVTFVDQAHDHVQAMQKEGLRIEGPIVTRRVAVRAFSPDELSGQYDLVFLAVKAHHTEEACLQIRPFLKDDGAVVSAQNGLNELVISKLLGHERTIGCFVNFGADYLSPGLIHYGGRAAVVTGELDGRTTERIHLVHNLLLKFDDKAILTNNIWGYLWSKQIYGAMLYATALTDEAIWTCLENPEYRDVFIALAREIAEIANHEGVRLEAFDGFDPDAYAQCADITAAHASLDALVAHNKRSAKTHSGIWRDLAIRHRKTEVDAQLGVIVKIAKQHHISAPLTSKLISLIHECEGGMQRDWNNLATLRSAIQEG